jgi:hypothetical protein
MSMKIALVVSIGFGTFSLSGLASAAPIDVLNPVEDLWQLPMGSRVRRQNPLRGRTLALSLLLASPRDLRLLRLRRRTHPKSSHTFRAHTQFLYQTHSVHDGKWGVT